MAPFDQLRRVLGREFGSGWQQKFASFDFEPVAAASIGQIHRARKHGGRELALKIQYPGVARSVDSDIDNLAGMLRRLDILPLRLDEVSFVAGGRPIVDRVSLEFEAGPRTIILGANGAGKSVLMRL